MSIEGQVDIKTKEGCETPAWSTFVRLFGV